MAQNQVTRMEGKKVSLYGRNFGKSAEQWDQDKIDELVRSNDPSRVMSYVSQFWVFDKLSRNYLFWNFEDKEPQLDKDIFKNPPFVGCQVMGNGWSLKNQYKSDPPCVNLIYSCQKKSGVHVINNVVYYNTFSGQRFEIPDEIPEFPESLVSSRDYILRHIKEVYCSNDEERYKEILNFIVTSVAGRKLGRMVHIVGEEGTGKSWLYEFYSALMGAGLIEQTTDWSVMKEGSNNSILLGKRLLIIEEAKNDNLNETKRMEEALKHFITGSHIKIQDKWMKARKVENIINVISFSNHPITQASISNRRADIMQTNSKYVGNKAYFTPLFDLLKNSNFCKHMYYWCLSEAAKVPKSWDTSAPLESVNKQMAKVACLNDVLVYLKSQHLLKLVGIEMKLKDLYHAYSCHYAGKPFFKPAQFLVQLRNLETNCAKKWIKKGHARITIVKIPIEDLYEYFANRNLILEEDDFEEIEEIDIPDFEYKNLAKPIKYADLTKIKEQIQLNRELVALRTEHENIMREMQDILRQQIADYQKVTAIWDQLNQKSKKVAFKEPLITNAETEAFGQLLEMFGESE